MGILRASMGAIGLNLIHSQDTRESMAVSQGGASRPVRGAQQVRCTGILHAPPTHIHHVPCRVILYSRFISRDKLFTNFSDMLLCVKILFANTVSPVQGVANMKMKSTKFLFAKYADASDSRNFYPRNKPAIRCQDVPVGVTVQADVWLVPLEVIQQRE